jgi:hypothetical protein
MLLLALADRLAAIGQLGLAPSAYADLQPTLGIAEPI